MSSSHNFETASLTTAAGVKIGYRKNGSGPALILLHGGLQSSASFTGLAAALSGDFTVYVPDRRGRGLSAPYQEKDGLEAEAADLLALIRHVHADRIFALSSGAIITLQAALKEPALAKVALYEPPLDGNIFGKLGRDYGRVMSKGNLGRAFITILKTIDDTTFSLFRTLPAFITAPMVNLMMRAQSKHNKEEPTLKDLVPTFYHDLIIIDGSAHLLAEAGQLKADTLLLQGGKSQPFLRSPIERLMHIIPRVRQVTFPEQGHMAADNTGDPQLVATELLKFFKEDK